MAQKVPHYLTDDGINAWLGEKNLQRGRVYQKERKVYNIELSVNKETLRALCSGSVPAPYRLWVSWKDGNIRDANCSCPVGTKGQCKHVAALLLEWRATNYPEDSRLGGDVKSGILPGFSVHVKDWEKKITESPAKRKIPTLNVVQYGNGQQTVTKAIFSSPWKKAEPPKLSGTPSKIASPPRQTSNVDLCKIAAKLMNYALREQVRQLKLELATKDETIRNLEKSLAESQTSTDTSQSIDSHLIKPAQLKLAKAADQMDTTSDSSQSRKRKREDEKKIDQFTPPKDVKSDPDATVDEDDAAEELRAEKIKKEALTKRQSNLSKLLFIDDVDMSHPEDDPDKTECEEEEAVESPLKKQKTSHSTDGCDVDMKEPAPTQSISLLLEDLTAPTKQKTPSSTTADSVRSIFDDKDMADLSKIEFQSQNFALSTQDTTSLISSALSTGAQGLSQGTLHATLDTLRSFLEENNIKLSQSQSQHTPVH